MGYVGLDLKIHGLNITENELPTMLKDIKEVIETRWMAI